MFHEVEGPEIVVAGDDSQRFAEVFHVETRRPMLNGLLNPHEPHSLAVVRSIIAKLIGKATAEGQKILFSVPAPRHNGHSIDSVGTGGRVVIVLADDIVLFPLFAIYEPDGKNVWFCGKSSVTRTLLSGRFFQNARIPRLEGLNLTIRQLIQQQRQRLCSTNPVERFAAALLISGELTKRLSKLNDCEIGELLDDEVGARLNIFAPELTICLAAADRLRRRANEHKHTPAPSKG